MGLPSRLENHLGWLDVHLRDRRGRLPPRVVLREFFEVQNVPVKFIAMSPSFCLIFDEAKIRFIWPDARNQLQYRNVNGAVVLIVCDPCPDSILDESMHNQLLALSVSADQRRLQQLVSSLAEVPSIPWIAEHVGAEGLDGMAPWSDDYVLLGS